MDTDEAWEEFRKNSERFQKTSIAEKLDALGAAINEIKADTERTALMVPKIMGDETALDSANDMAGADGGLAPEMPPEMGGEMDMMNENEQMPPEAGAPAEGGAPPMDAGADTIEGAEMPMDDAGAADMGGEAPEGEDYLSDEDIDAILNGTYGGGEGAPEDAEPDLSAGEDLPPVGDEYPDIPATGGAGLAEAANNLLAALKDAAHEAVDAGDLDKIMELAKVEQQITQTLGGVVGLTEPDTTAPAPEDAGEAEIEADDVSDELPADDEGAPDVISNLEEDTGEAESEPAPEVDEEVVEETETKDEPKEEPKSESKPEKKDEKKDEDTESTKKSMADIDAQLDASIQASIEAHFEKSEPYIPPTPTLKDMMSGSFDMRSFIKGDREGYIDAAEIFKDPEVDKPNMEGVVDGGTFLMKSDDRIATARSIFDRELMTGRTDPGSVATAGTAQEALAQTGETDPGSVSTAEAIVNMKKSEEDVSSMPKMSGGETDPDSIATAGTAQEAIAHTGKQDPDSVATADVPVNMNGGDDSEGSTTKIDVKIEKSSLDDYTGTSDSDGSTSPASPPSKSSSDMMYPAPYNHVPMPEPAPAGLTTKKPTPEIPEPPAFDSASTSNMEAVNAKSNQMVDRRANRASANAPAPEIGADDLNLPSSAPENVNFKAPPKPMKGGPTTDRGVARLGSGEPNLIPETNESDHIENLLSQYDKGANRGVPDTIRPATKPTSKMDSETYDKVSSMVRAIKKNPNISPEDKREILYHLQDIYGDIYDMPFEENSYVGGETPSETARDSIYEHAGTMYDEDGNPISKSDGTVAYSDGTAPADVPVEKSEDLAPAAVDVSSGSNITKDCGPEIEKSGVQIPEADLAKSAPGKHIMTLQEMMSVAKSDSRPSSASSSGANMSSSSINDIFKSADSGKSVKMGRGVDPMKVIENDLKEYNLYKARNKF